LREIKKEANQWASTIPATNQSKNVFMARPEAFRKGLEAYFTVLNGAYWVQKRIMEVYLNVMKVGEESNGNEAVLRPIQ